MNSCSNTMKRRKTTQNLSRLCVLASILATATSVVTGCFSVNHTPGLSTACAPTHTANATLMPLPPSAITPVPRWVEYESVLARAFLPKGISGLCEWEILGQQEREVYVWALCIGNSPISGPMAMSAPAVVYLETDGNIQSVRVPRDGILGTQDVKTFFPPDVQGKVFAYRLSPDMEAHISKRLADPSVPPLVIVSGTPMP